MNAIVAFVLALTAVVSTVLIVWSPFDRLMKQMEGKKSSDYSKKIEDMTTEQTIQAVIKYGCGFGCLFAVSVLLGWVFEPIFVFGGLVNHMGNLVFGCVAGIVILISWLRALLSATFPKQKPAGQIAHEAVEEAMAKTVAGYKPTPYKSDEPLKINWFTYYFWKVLGAIPTAYLWYLLAIMIGLLPNG